MRTVLVFGAFDPLHAGHANFLGHARALGERLVVALASDDAIRTLKGHAPRAPFEERKQLLAMLPSVDEIVPSDATGTFAIVDELQPDIIALGYDQDALRIALEEWMATHKTIPLATMEPYEPEKYKSSLMNG